MSSCTRVQQELTLEEATLTSQKFLNLKPASKNLELDATLSAHDGATHTPRDRDTTTANEGFIQVWEYSPRQRPEERTDREDKKAVAATEVKPSPDEVTDNQLRELVRILACVTTQRAKREDNQTIWFGRKRKVDLSLSTLTGRVRIWRGPPW